MNEQEFQAKYAKVLHIDSVFPNAWSDKYHKANSFLACIACGRNTSKQGESQGVWIVDGAAGIAHPDEPEMNDGGDMGWFPVGSECIKKVPAEYRAENPYDNKVKGV
jgi:hypothetical protein